MLLYDYIPILLMTLLAISFAVGSVLMSFLIGPRIDDPEKLDTYECGMPPVGNAKEPFNVKFFLVAMLFVIFDIEIIFLVLWAVAFKELAWYGLAVIGFFLAILVVSLIYELKKGVLEWASKVR
ncbi:MAG: NADH-quinone oxidoreductase subunit A [Candidatus Hinthialibacter antarcticus]|nr:NADH-quinone oxidoreductase subunit A [Candidatus Hinthialibacter antarcticus]